jgi:hypothetical protein
MASMIAPNAIRDAHADRQAGFVRDKGVEFAGGG